MARFGDRLVPIASQRHVSVHMDMGEPPLSFSRKAIPMKANKLIAPIVQHSVLVGDRGGAIDDFVSLLIVHDLVRMQKIECKRWNVEACRPQLNRNAAIEAQRPNIISSGSAWRMDNRRS